MNVMKHVANEITIHSFLYFLLCDHLDQFIQNKNISQYFSINIIYVKDTHIQYEHTVTTPTGWLHFPHTQ